MCELPDFDARVLVALDAAIDTEPMIDYQEAGFARANWVAKTVGREVGVHWDYGGDAWHPSEGGTRRVVAAMQRLRKRGFVERVDEDYRTRGWTVTQDGDAWLAEREAD